MRPTDKKEQDARQLLEEAEFPDVDDAIIDAICTLVDATEAPTDEQCEAEAKRFYENGMLRPLSPKQRILYAYESGMRREYKVDEP